MTITRKRGRRAVLFTFDALLASLLLLAALLVILHYARSPQTATQTSHYAQDAILALNTIQVGDLHDPWVQALITNGTIADPTVSVLAQIGAFWATNQTDLAQNLSALVITGLLPNDVGLSLTMGDELLFTQNTTNEAVQRAVGRRMITGIQSGSATLEGSTSVAYLKRIKDKKSFVITYYGGFVGQGNLTTQLSVPNDVTPATITDITVQLDTVDDFDLRINGVPCTTLVSDRTMMTVQSWNITACSGSIVPGINNITYIQRGTLETAYLAGGFIKVSYLTNTFQEEGTNATTTRYTFPLIDGIINLYDSVAVPGIINDWYLNLSYYSNYTVFFRLGNQTIFNSPGSNATQNILLEGHNLKWAPQTIPLRLGTTNFTNVTIVTSGQPADTAIITDISGSMGDVVVNNCTYQCNLLNCTYDCVKSPSQYTKSCISSGRCSRNTNCGGCNTGYTAQNFRLTTMDTSTKSCLVNPPSSSCSNLICGTCKTNYTGQNYTSLTQTKLDIAKAADKTAVNVILNQSGNRVGLVSYNQQVQQILNPTSDPNILNTGINGYNAGGTTCICCGINRAKDMLNASVNKRFMILMTDGQANYYCNGFNTYVGINDYPPYARSISDTIASGQNACNHNITVYTVAFGADADQDTLRRTACNDSLFYDASNISQLELIYQNISQQILLTANYTAEIIVVTGTYTPSHVYYGTLDLNYTPIVAPPAQNEILVKFETPQFANCTTSLVIPPGLRLFDAGVTSYSGPYWTSYLAVNGQEVFNLSRFSTDYNTVGDPFLVGIPVNYLDAPNNTIQLLIADNTQVATNCSSNNSVFYSGLINSSVPRSSVLSKAIGCHWTLEFDDGHFLNVTIPPFYSGAQNCTYTNASHDANSFDPNDAYDYGVFHLMEQLDFNNDGRIFVNLQAADLEIIVTVVTRVPYLWGPTLASVEAWR
jgi:hypothetical protein